MNRPRNPGVAYAVIFAVLVILVGVLALTQRQAPPPTIAEFAPQAIENISDAPGDQSSTTGRSSQESPDPEGFGAADQTPPPIDVPRVRRCVGDPPRQIEDPQSPPCVPYWTGDNGGSTAFGVTRDSIDVLVQNGDTNNGPRVNVALTAFFNRRFEFYGRQLKYNFASQGPDDCTGKRGQAQSFRARGAFAIVGVMNGSETGCSVDETARLKILDVRIAGETDAHMAERRPFLWRYGLNIDESLREWGAFACASLVGQNATHAPDPLLRTRQRKFGLIIQREQNPPMDAHGLEEELERCGTDVMVRDLPLERNGPDSGVGNHSVQTTNAVLQMKTENVTSVFCYCPVFLSEEVSAAATGQSYHPEWIVNDNLASNLAIKGFWPNSDQRAGLMGLSSLNAHLPYRLQPLNYALAEVDPSLRITSTADFNNDQQVYADLLVLASGIQMAGPNLTPQTFEAALKRTVFPNPRSTLSLGSVGFGPSKYSMIRDNVAMWWSDAGISPFEDEGIGAWCYAYRAKRFSMRGWPRGESDMFRGPCLAMPPDAAFP